MKLSPQSRVLFYKVFFNKKKHIKLPSQASNCGRNSLSTPRRSFFSIPFFSKCGIESCPPLFKVVKSILEQCLDDTDPMSTLSTFRDHCLLVDVPKKCWTNWCKNGMKNQNNEKWCKNTLKILQTVSKFHPSSNKCYPTASSKTIYMNELQKTVKCQILYIHKISCSF